MKNNTSGPREEEEGWRSPGVGWGDGGGGSCVSKNLSGQISFNFYKVIKK